MSTERPDDIVRLGTAENPAQAHVWEQALLAEGIKCMVVGDYLDASFGDIPGLKPELWVYRRNAQRAETSRDSTPRWGAHSAVETHEDPWYGPRDDGSSPVGSEWAVCPCVRSPPRWPADPGPSSSRSRT